MRKQIILTLFILFSVGWGCSYYSQPQAPFEFQAVNLPLQTPTPEICSTNPPGLGIQALLGRRDNDGQVVTVKGIGFIPDEKLIIRIAGQGDQHGYGLEALDHHVQADGSFTMEEILPLDDPSMNWEVHVVHQRGVACLRFRTER